MQGFLKKYSFNLNRPSGLDQKEDFFKNSL